MSRLISGIYNSIYTPTELLTPARKRSRHGRKVDRELETTLRQIARPRRKKAKKPLTERGRESHRKQQARWAKENPECIADAQKKWRDKQDPELFRDYARDAYALHGEKIRAKRMAYYWANREGINARRRAKVASHSQAAGRKAP